MLLNKDNFPNMSYCLKQAYRANITILLTKATAAQNEDALSYLRVRGLYYLAVVFVATILHLESRLSKLIKI